MGYQNDRDQFIAAMAGASVSVADARKLLSLAATLDRLAVAACNGDWPAENGERTITVCPRCERAWAPSTVTKRGCLDCRTEDRVRALCTDAKLTPEFNGDPRGYVLRVTTPNGRQHGVPTRS